MQVNQQKTVQVEAKTVEILAKVRDSGYYTIRDQDGESIGEHDGYVPSYFPGGGGDYLELVIDLDTGQILNWGTPSVEKVERYIGEGEE